MKWASAPGSKIDCETLETGLGVLSPLLGCFWASGSHCGVLEGHHLRRSSFSICSYLPQRPAQQTPHSAPPVQSELSWQKCGTHHLGPVPVPFVTHFSMKRSLAAAASILPIACSAQAICTSVSHFFTKLMRASPASFCWAAFALQVDRRRPYY